MKRSYVIALSAVSCALAVIAVVVQGYLPTMRIAVNVIAALCVALPLTKDSFAGALLAYVCASLIGFFTVNLQALPFIMLFGAYALVAWLLDFRFYRLRKLNKWFKIAVITVVKIGFFFLMFWACLQLMQTFVADWILNEYDWSVPVLYALGFAIFCLYDPLYRWVFRCMCTLVGRHVRGGGGKSAPPRSGPTAPISDKAPEEDIFGEEYGGNGGEGEHGGEDNGNKNGGEAPSGKEREDSGKTAAGADE